MSTLGGTGFFLGDEIVQSSDPERHARDIISTMLVERVQWVCQQTNDMVGDSGATQEDAMKFLRQSSLSYRYGAVGGWAQGMPSAQEVERAVRYGEEFHFANVESKHDNENWQTADMDVLLRSMPAGVSVIFQQGGFDYDTPGNAGSSQSKAHAKRWIERGFAAYPEAIQSENPQATISKMQELALTLGWTHGRIGYALYLTKGYPAIRYQGEIEMTAGRWCIFRYGDIDQEDKVILRMWPRPGVAPPPPKDPPPPVEPKITSEQTEAEIEAALTKNIDGGGLKTVDALASVQSVTNSWQARQLAQHSTMTEKQRLNVIEAISRSTDPQWNAADDEIVAVLKKHGIKITFPSAG